MTKTIKDIQAKVIKDSISPDKVRLSTLELYYPRMVHADFMTHRKFSRNASSSRATPVRTLLAKSMDELYIPRFRYNKPGMQPGAYFTPEDQKKAEDHWTAMAHACSQGVWELSQLGVHKQWANRPLEWFGWIKVLVSATEFMNYFALRQDVDSDGFPMAQDEIKYLADRMREAIDNSRPRLLQPGQWHLPYVSDEEEENELVRTNGNWEELIRMSAARCARVSYLNMDNTKPTREKDAELYHKLAGSRPIHASPMEHQATPDKNCLVSLGSSERRWARPKLHGNYIGWIQGRKLIPNEYVPG